MQALTLKAIMAPLELVDRPDLEPAAGEAVVQLTAAALNRRDYWITQGLYPQIRPPIVLGSDGAGVVAAVGDGVDAQWLARDVIINPGFDWGSDQKVQAANFTILGLPRDGTFATQVAVPVDQLYAKPVELNWQEAAALPLGAVTAYRAVFSQGALQPHETVLITGVGGGVATFALQFAVAAQANVWVTSSSSEKIQRAVQLGARGGFNYRKQDWAKQLANAAGSVDLVIDGAGGPGYASLLHLASPGGRIVNYGATAGPPETLDLFRIFWKQLTLQGSTMGSPSDFTDMLAFVKEHHVKPIIHATYPLVEGNEAIQQMKASPQFGKFVLTIA